MPLADRFLTIHRDPHSEEVLARSGDVEAHSVLQRAGFIPVVRVHESYHRAPTGLDEDDERRLATEAVARLRAVGYHVDCDEDFDTDRRPARDLPLGASVAQVAERIHQATTTQEVAAALTELTASHDGILAAIDQILTATASFHDGLGDPADAHIARRLRYLADEHLHVIRTDLAHTRDALADRTPRTPAAAPAPNRSPPTSVNGPPCAPAHHRRAPLPSRPAARGLACAPLTPPHLVQGHHCTTTKSPGASPRSPTFSPANSPTPGPAPTTPPHTRTISPN